MPAPTIRARTHLEIVAAANVLLGNPDLGHGGSVGRQGSHRLPHLGGIWFLLSESRMLNTNGGDVET